MSVVGGRESEEEGSLWEFIVVRGLCVAAAVGCVRPAEIFWSEVSHFGSSVAYSPQSLHHYG